MAGRAVSHGPIPLAELVCVLPCGSMCSLGRRLGRRLDTRVEVGTDEAILSQHGLEVSALDPRRVRLRLSAHAHNSYDSSLRLLCS